MQDVVCIARIKNGRVENIEVASPEWVESEQGQDGFTFVVYSEEECINIGMRWSDDVGFYPDKSDSVDNTLSQFAP